jgi:hypothetical protein
MLRHVTVKLIVLAVLLGASMVGQSLAAAGQSEDSIVTGCLQAGAKEGESCLPATTSRRIRFSRLRE